MTKSNIIDVRCQVKHTTDKAALLFDGEKEVWVPLSQIEIDSSEKATTAEDVVSMPEWLAHEKGLI